MSGSDQQQQLEYLAYLSWLERGRPIGSPDVDWRAAVELFNQITHISGPPEPEPVVREQVALAGKPRKAYKEARVVTSEVEAPMLTDVLQTTVGSSRSTNQKAGTKRNSARNPSSSKVGKFSAATNAFGNGETPLEIPPGNPAPPPPTPTQATATA